MTAGGDSHAAATAMVVETGPASLGHARAALPAPRISSIGGYTSAAAGIYNGIVDMPTGGGEAWDRYRALNDQPGIYTWTINGSNFGTTRGTVRLAGRATPILSWSDSSIRINPSGAQINPSQPWNWGPMSTTPEVRKADESCPELRFPC